MTETEIWLANERRRLRFLPETFHLIPTGPFAPFFIRDPCYAPYILSIGATFYVKILQKALTTKSVITEVTEIAFHNPEDLPEDIEVRSDREARGQYRRIYNNVAELTEKWKDDSEITETVGAIEVGRKVGNVTELEMGTTNIMERDVAEEDGARGLRRLEQSSVELALSEQDLLIQRNNSTFLENTQPAGFSVQVVEIHDDQINDEIIKAIKEWRTVYQDWRGGTEEQHLRWLRRYGQPTKHEWVVDNSNQAGAAAVMSLVPDISEYINWGTLATAESFWHDDERIVIWDEVASLTYDNTRPWLAIGAQPKTSSNALYGEHNLSHAGLDVEGVDAVGRRIRARRLLEVKLAICEIDWQGVKAEQTTWVLQQSIILKEPLPSSIPPRKSRDKESHQSVLEQVAQREVDKAIDERDDIIRKIFQREIEPDSTRRNSTFGAHYWKVRGPMVQIEESNGVVLRLLESWSDGEDGDFAMQTHNTTLIQISPGGQSHLFDLPTEGTDDGKTYSTSSEENLEGD
ncbi:hypothetical protein G7Y89_g12944 [Cudoniella acicularis]|uniref:Uncharacterized protein n=1 Tax=Cudoniella acicularis TaxID=354080 RepID=A0A8H4VWH9_9HELO|nr:hypothetical protein G7Y89_g12944 [Cudoniella acicularis]